MTETAPAALGSRAKRSPSLISLRSSSVSSNSNTAGREGRTPRWMAGALSGAAQIADCHEWQRAPDNGALRTATHRLARNASTRRCVPANRHSRAIHPGRGNWHSGATRAHRRLQLSPWQASDLPANQSPAQLASSQARAATGRACRPTSNAALSAAVPSAARFAMPCRIAASETC